jgi:hypothetical protein
MKLQIQLISIIENQQLKITIKLNLYQKLGHLPIAKNSQLET